MSFNYQVLLKPNDVKFTVKRIPSRFDNGTLLKDLLEDLKSGKIVSKDISAAEVVWDSDRWEWYSLSNRRLWVFKELEKVGKISFISMSRVETTVDGESNNSPKSIYSEVELFDPDWDITIDTLSEPKGTNKIMAEELKKPSSQEKKENNEKNQKKDVNNNSNVNEWISDGDKQKEGISKSMSKSKPKRRLSEDVEEEWVERDVDKKRSRSLSHGDSKLSLYNSTHSLFSNTSSAFTSISRNQRKIDKQSGLHGYGNFNTYKTEYLDKIRAEKRAILRKYKPYNSRSSSKQSLSRSSSYGKLSRSSRSYSCNSMYSESLTTTTTTVQEERRSSFSEKASSTTSLERQTRRMRLYSDDIEETREEKSREFIPYRSSSKSSLIGSLVPLSGGIKLADLYALWQRRRVDYLRSSRLAITNGAATGYICGLCYKKFDTIVDLQQHCGALLHYACITCGKFFSSYASLGQHCQELRHQKD